MGKSKSKQTKQKKKREKDVDTILSNVKGLSDHERKTLRRRYADNPGELLRHLYDDYSESISSSADSARVRVKSPPSAPPDPDVIEADVHYSSVGDTQILGSDSKDKTKEVDEDKLIDDFIEKLSFRSDLEEQHNWIINDQKIQ